MSRRRHPGGFVVATALAVVALAAAIPGAGASARSDQTTITMLVNTLDQPAYVVLIANFERVYPNITVNATYIPGTTLNQLEPTELGAGNGPDLVWTGPGCSGTISVCVLAKAGELAPMLKVPWAKRSLPLVTSLNKYGGALLGFEPGTTFAGMFTNDTLFRKLGLKIPQTFSQLLTVCQKAKAAGVYALYLPGTAQSTMQLFVEGLAIPYVYGPDKHWAAEQKAGTVTFDGSAGWHRALQEFIDMSNAGCFEPGMPGTTQANELFFTGQALMNPGLSSLKGQIDMANPQFSYSFHPFPAGSTPNATQTFVHLSGELGINAHSSAAAQAAAQTFVNFIARPKQNALYAQVRGGLTQYEFLHGQLPSFMSSFTPVLQHGQYVMDPSVVWPNPNVGTVMSQDEIGLITGQTTIDGMLSAMDAAWKQGPS
jgi:raffinose/stachyose/melibiose transport system substrate-binding protein